MPDDEYKEWVAGRVREFSEKISELEKKITEFGLDNDYLKKGGLVEQMLDKIEKLEKEVFDINKESRIDEALSKGDSNEQELSELKASSASHTEEMSDEEYAHINLNRGRWTGKNWYYKQLGKERPSEEDKIYFKGKTYDPTFHIIWNRRDWKAFLKKEFENGYKNALDHIKISNYIVEKADLEWLIDNSWDNLSEYDGTSVSWYKPYKKRLENIEEKYLTEEAKT